VLRGFVPLVLEPDDRRFQVILLIFDVPEVLGEVVGEVRYIDLITVRMPMNTDAAFFALPVTSRVAMSQTSRIAYDEAGTPCRLMITIYPAERNQFRIAVVHAPPEEG
jgi:hypothetical protein